MDMNGQERIEAPLDTVWQGLNDVGILRRCIPGCEALEKLSDTNMTATVVLRIGPIKATFEGMRLLAAQRPGPERLGCRPPRLTGKRGNRYAG